jgi:hypothetical protein
VKSRLGPLISGAQNIGKGQKKKNTIHIPKLNFNGGGESFFDCHKKLFRKTAATQEGRKNQTFNTGNLDRNIFLGQAVAEFEELGKLSLKSFGIWHFRAATVKTNLNYNFQKSPLMHS